MTFRTPTAPGTTVSDDAYAEGLAGATTDLHLDTARALCALSDTWGDRLLPQRPHYPLISRLTRDLVSAGYAIHDCAARERTGGVCLTPCSDPAAGVVVTWSTHAVLAVDEARHDQGQGQEVVDLMNFSLTDVLCALGWQADPCGQTSAHVVTGRLRPLGVRRG